MHCFCPHDDPVNGHPAAWVVSFVARGEKIHQPLCKRYAWIVRQEPRTYQWRKTHGITPRTAR